MYNNSFLSIKREEIRDLLWPEWVYFFYLAEMTNIDPRSKKNILEVPYRNLSFQDVEEKMSNVYRWENKIKKNNMRYHTVWQHTCSATISLEAILFFANYKKINRKMMLTAFYIHDFGEGLLNRDIKKYNQGEKVDMAIHDLEEYQAVKEYLINKIKKKEDYVQYHLSFLLQFAYDYGQNREKYLSWPKEAQKTLEFLWKQEKEASLWFRSLELWGYLIYATEQYIYYYNIDLLAEVIKNDYPQFKKALQQTQKLKQIIFAPKTKKFLDQALSTL